MNKLGNVLKLHKNAIQPLYLAVFQLNYAKAPGSVSTLGAKGKKKIGKMGPMIEKKVIPVESDPMKLVNFVCGSNINKEGADVALRPDSEYPDWLWTLRTGKPPPLEELDPNTKEYWRRIRTMALRRNNQLRKVRKF